MNSDYICKAWQINSHLLNESIVCPVYEAKTPNRKFWFGRDCTPVAFAFACTTRNYLEVRILFSPKYGVAIMVNGCFWHGHKGCQYATKPKTNVEFWEAKIHRNRHRDEVTNAHLEALGWYVITVWECELRTGSLWEDRLDALEKEVRYAGELKTIKEEEKLQSKFAAIKENEEMLRKQARLEKEINSLYPIPKRIKKASGQCME